MKLSESYTGRNPMLQWGRSGEGAEDRWPLGRGQVRWLRWGRSGEGAEDWATTRYAFATGFNGAAPVRERKTGSTLTNISARSAVLQWGRSGEGAEDEDGSEAEPDRWGFNGAAPVRERKTGATARRRAQGSFNGAAPVRERKTRARPAAQGRQASMGPLR